MERRCAERLLLAEPTRLLGDSLSCTDDIGLVGVESDVVTSCSQSSDRRGPNSYERVEHDVVFVGVELDQAFGQLHRERGRMTDTSCAFGCDLPQIRRRLQELVARDRRGGRIAEPESFFWFQCAIESALARDDDPLGHVPQDRVARTLERAPRARTARRSPLPPDDFAA